MRTWKANIINGRALRSGLLDKLKNVVTERFNDKYSREDIVDVLLAAALRKESIEYSADGPNGDTVFYRLKKDLSVEKLQSLIYHSRPKIRHPILVSIDVHDQMTWSEKVPYVIGTAEKNGSFRAFKFLTAKSASQPRCVLDVDIMKDGSVTDATIAMLERLLKDYKMETVLMDGGFPSSQLIEYLTSKGINYVCRFRSTSKLRKMDIEYKTPYLYRTQYRKRCGRPNTVASEYYIYRYHGRGKYDYYLISNMLDSPEEIRELFRRRWDIETGYREQKRLKIKTTTRNYLLRLLFFLISSIIYNLWIRLKDTFGFRLNHIKSALLKAILKTHEKEAGGTFGTTDKS